MKFVNMTPHVLNILTPNGVRVLKPSGVVPRVETTVTFKGEIDGIPFSSVSTGECVGLPEEEEGVFLVVSGLVARSANRKDVLFPGELVRDDNGVVKGCWGLSSV